jgi:hypothetical protein
LLSDDDLTIAVYPAPEDFAAEVVDVVDLVCELQVAVDDFATRALVMIRRETNSVVVVVPVVLDFEMVDDVSDRDLAV